MILMCSITASAAEPVTPKTKFSYKGTDVQSSVESVYRTDHAYFKDEADILTTSSEKSLWEKIQTVSAQLKINVAVFIGGNYRTDDETVTFTMNAISSVFGSYSDTLFIYLDFEGYSPAYDYIRASNNAEDIFNDTKRNKILNAMYQKLPKSTEPVYEEDVRQGIADGIDEIKSQGYVNTPQSSYNSRGTYQDTADDRGYYPERDPEPENKGSSSTPMMPIIIGAFVVIIILLIISSIVKSITRKIGSFGRSSYRSSYYDHDDGYYGRRDHYHRSYRSRPPRPPKPPRPPRDHGPSGGGRPPRSSSPPKSSSRHDSPHSSGSGHYR